MVANEKFLPLDEIEAGLDRLGEAITRQNPVLVRQILAELVGEYQPSPGIVDYLSHSPAKPRLRMISTSTG